MKNKLISSLLAATLLSASSAFALDLDPKFYVGGEVQANKAKGQKKTINDFVKLRDGDTNKDNPLTLKQDKLGLGVFIGSRIHENVGIEAGYARMGTAKYKGRYDFGGGVGLPLSSAIELKSKNIYFDVLGFMPISQSADLIGSIGVGQLKTKVAGGSLIDSCDIMFSEVKGQSSKKTGLRLGLGAQYKLNENVGARFMIRHQKGNDFLKSVNSAGLGLFYQF